MKSTLYSLLRMCGASLWIALTALLIVSVSLSAAVKREPALPRALTHPYLKSWYDGQRNLPLAAYSGGALTEQEMYLFRLMKRESDPALFETWEKSRRAKERDERTQDVEQALRNIAFTYLLADRTPDRPLSPTDEKFVRFLKYPVYQLVWIQKFLKPEMKIEPIDLIKYYHDHVGEFYQPESVRVRYIFREVLTTATIAERDAVETEMKALRDRAAAGEDFVELARAKSDAPSAIRGGELPLIHRGMFVENFENQAFALAPGQLSPVFLGRGGFYLIQCLEKLPEQQVSFEVAQKDLREAVEQKTLAYLYHYHLTRLVRRGRYDNLTARFQDLLPQENLLLIGNYRMTKNEFLEMFPYAITEPLELDRNLIAATCQNVLRGELVAQQVEELGLARDPLLVAADRIARRIVRCNEGLRAALKVPLTFSEPQIKSYYEENRNRLGYQPQWRVFSMQASVRNPYLRQPSQMQALRGDLRAQFEQVLQEFQIAFREERSRTAADLVLAGESSPTLAATVKVLDDEADTATARFRRQIMPQLQCLTLFTGASTTDYQFTVTDLGYRNFRDEKIYPYIKDLHEADLGPIAAMGPGGFACYFIERYIPETPLDYDKIRVHVRQQYIAFLQAEALDRLRTELADKSALRISLPEIGSKEK